MLTHDEISTYSLQAEQGDYYSLCALAIEKMLSSANKKKGEQQLRTLAQQDPENLVYIALRDLKDGNKEQALLTLAKATDAGSSYAPYYLWTLMKDDTRYLRIAKERGNLLALRASLCFSPTFGSFKGYLEDHNKAMQQGDFDSYFFCCSDGFAYYKPELSFLQQNLYTPLLKKIFDTSTSNAESIKYAALSGLRKAFPLQVNILMEQKKWTEALFWLLPAQEDAEQLKDIGICYMEMYRNTKKEEYLHQAISSLIQAKELDSLDAQEQLKPFKKDLRYLQPSHWIYSLPPYWVFYLIVLLCVVRIALFFIYPLGDLERYLCIGGISLGAFFSAQRVPSFVYAITNESRIIKHGIRQRNIWAYAKHDRYIYKAARVHHLESMHQMGVQGNSDYLRTAAEMGHVPSILSLYHQEPEKLIDVLTNIDEQHHIEVHRTLGMVYFEKSDYNNARKHLLMVLAKEPKNKQVKRAYAWSLHQKNPFSAQWILCQLAEDGDIESLFRLQELQRLIKTNDIPFPFSTPDLPEFPDIPYIKPKTNILTLLPKLSIQTLRRVTDLLGEDVWRQCSADTILKKKLVLAKIGDDLYPRPDEELVLENAEHMYDNLREIYHQNELYISEQAPELIPLLLQVETSLEDLCCLDSSFARHIHDYKIADLINKAFVLASPKLKKWVLFPLGEKSTQKLMNYWEETLIPLSEIVKAQEALITWLIENPNIPFPVSSPLSIETRVSQTLIQEYLSGAPKEDIQTLEEASSSFWPALAFLSSKNIKKVIVSLDINSKEKEKKLHEWIFHSKLQRLYEDSFTSIYAESSRALLQIILEKIKSKELGYRPFSIRLYAIPFDKYPEQVLELILNESKSPLSVLASIQKVRRYGNIFDFYSEDIRETGMLIHKNKRYHIIRSYLLVRSLMNKGLIKRKMFEHQI